MGRARLEELFAQINIPNRGGELGEDLKILRLPVVGAADEKDEPDRGFIESVPLNSFGSLNANYYKEVRQCGDFCVGNGDAHANSSRDDLLPLQDCGAE